MVVGQHEALPTSLPGSPAVYDTERNEIVVLAASIVTRP